MLITQPCFALVQGYTLLSRINVAQPAIAVAYGGARERRRVSLRRGVASENATPTPLPRHSPQRGEPAHGGGSSTGRSVARHSLNAGNPRTGVAPQVGKPAHGTDLGNPRTLLWLPSLIALSHRPHLRSTNDSWRVDETYIEVKGEWKYLYRAVDSKGNANPPYPPTDRRGAEVASPLP